MSNDDRVRALLHYSTILHQLAASFTECQLRWKMAEKVGFAIDREGRPTRLTLRWAESIGGPVRMYGSGFLQ